MKLPLLLLMIYIASALVFFTPINSQQLKQDLFPVSEGDLIHQLVFIGPYKTEYVEFFVNKDEYVLIHIYEFYALPVQIKIVRPDHVTETRGSYAVFTYKFTALVSGKYRIELYNPYSDIKLWVSVAVGISEQPLTITEIKTITNIYTTTTTRTTTTTTTRTNTEIVTDTVTVTQIDWPTTYLISVLTLTIGFLVGYILAKPK